MRNNGVGNGTLRMRKAGSHEVIEQTKSSMGLYSVMLDAAFDNTIQLAEQRPLLGTVGLADDLVHISSRHGIQSDCWAATRKFEFFNMLHKPEKPTGIESAITI